MLKKKEHRRLIIVGSSLFFLFSLLLLQFYRLQIIEEKKWKKVAKSQHEVVIKEPAKRGVFYSNVGLKPFHLNKPTAFVIDVPKYHLYVDSMMIPKNTRRIIADKIVELLPHHNLSLEKIEKECARRSRSRKLALWISKGEKQKIMNWWRHYYKKNHIAANALFFIKDYKRCYPFGKLLGQVLHTIRDEKDATTNQCYPTGGLEVYFNQYLQGKPGRRILERSPRNRLATEQVLQQPEPGADIYLTINHYLQAITEEELAKGIQRVGAKGGWAVMMNPHNGEIYALAQYPFFEPANYRTYYNKEEFIEYTKTKAISDCFEPGSTFKPITAAIALLANEVLRSQNKPLMFDPEEMVSTSDGSLPGRKPMKDVRFHSYLNMDLAIQKSSNIYMAKLAQGMIDHLGSHWYRKQIQSIFGFGDKTGIELPYENAGLLPTPGKKYPNGHLQWTLPTPYSLSIGYNILTNSIQMVRAIAVFANQGYLVKPHLVKRVVNQTQNKVLYEGDCTRKKVLNEQIANRIVRSMKYVTKKGGAAPLAEIYGYTEAGKTSTSEKIVNGGYSKSIHFSTFVGFAPVNNPEFVLMVCVNEPKMKYIHGFGMTHYGGKCSAPIFREIARRSLEYLGTPMDDPFGFPKGDPRSDLDQADWMKENEKLTNLYKKWNET